MNPTQKHKKNVRMHDRQWFSSHLPQTFRDGLTIHHTWDKGDFCFLVSPEKHKMLDEAERNG